MRGVGCAIVAGPSFQDQIPLNHCWGCGRDNPEGLGIASYWADDRGAAVCEFVPRPEHAAGPTTVLNGGIIATLIDCHSICTAIAATYRDEGRSIGSEPLIWCVTASLDIDYLKPTPIGGGVELIATVVESGRRKTRVTCSVSAEGIERARGDVLAIRVPPFWLVDPAGPPM